MILNYCNKVTEGYLVCTFLVSMCFLTCLMKNIDILLAGLVQLKKTTEAVYGCTTNAWVSLISVMVTSLKLILFFDSIIELQESRSISWQRRRLSLSKPLRDAWWRFLTPATIAKVQDLTGVERVSVFVIDDSVFERKRSKSVELLSRFMDHANGIYYKGFRMLTLGWSTDIRHSHAFKYNSNDGSQVYPATLSLPNLSCESCVVNIEKEQDLLLIRA